VTFKVFASIAGSSGCAICLYKLLIVEKFKKIVLIKALSCRWSHLCQPHPTPSSLLYHEIDSIYLRTPPSDRDLNDSTHRLRLSSVFYSTQIWPVFRIFHITRR